MGAKKDCLKAMLSYCILSVSLLVSLCIEKTSDLVSTFDT